MLLESTFYGRTKQIIETASLFKKKYFRPPSPLSLDSFSGIYIGPDEKRNKMKDSDNVDGVDSGEDFNSDGVSKVEEEEEKDERERKMAILDRKNAEDGERQRKKKKKKG